MSSTGGKAAQTPHARYLGFREEIRQTEYRKEFKRRRNELIIAKEVRLQTNRHHDQEGRIVAMLVNKDVDYDTVNDFIRDKERGMSAELQRALLEHLLNQHSIDNEDALATAANLLNCRDFSVRIESVVDVKNYLEKLFIYNINEGRLAHGRTIAWLVSSMFAKADQLEAFLEVREYYELIQQSVGLLDLSFLMLISQLSHSVNLLPGAGLIERIIHSQVPYVSPNQNKQLREIVQLLDNYIRYSKDEGMYLQTVNWIQGRLKECKCPSNIKPILINLFICIVNSQDSGSALVQQICGMSIISELICRGRFGSPQTKVPALVALSYLIEKGDEDIIKNLVENTDLIELFVSGLEIEDNQMLFRLIAGIGIILAHNSKYKPVMEAFGLKKYLKRLCVSECERVSQLVATVYESFF